MSAFDPKQTAAHGTPIITAGTAGGPGNPQCREAPTGRCSQS